MKENVAIICNYLMETQKEFKLSFNPSWSQTSFSFDDINNKVVRILLKENQLFVVFNDATTQFLNNTNELFNAAGWKQN